MHQETINGIVTLVALGAGSQWIAWRLRIPSILVLLAVGFIAGPLTGFFAPDEVLGSLVFPFVALAAAVVLFEGGLTASWEEIKGVATPVRRLIVLGIPITWAILSTAGHYLLGLRVELALLLGAILVVTGPTVIGPLLRHARPRGSVGSVLKLEGIINDPIGAILAVLVFQGIRAEEIDRAFTVVSAGILKAALVSLLLGSVAAFLFVRFRERDVLPEFLHNAVVLPCALVVYAGANHIQEESGLLAVTIMGIALASQKRVSMEQSLEFTEHVRILLISTLFILLTARMQLSDITGLPIAALAFVAVVIFVARPASVLLSTVRSGLSVRERIFLGAMAPRGVVAAAVSSLFALELVETGYEEASILMPITFAVIALTVLTSGLSAVPLLRRLGLAQKKPQGVLIVGADRVGRTIAQALRQQGFPALLVDSDLGKVEEARSLGLEVVKGEVLSRRVLRSLDLDGIGYLLALTPNDDVNTLAAAHFLRLFGADNVYQIQPSSHRGRPMPGYASELQAHTFAGGATLGKLEALAKSGGAVTVTAVEETPTLEQMREQLGLDAVPLFAVSDDGDLSFIRSDEPLPSAAKLVVLTPP
ncbi:MAG: cation:proton antiporter [Myxococcales bacterium]|nr:cation:proton antiporter [Myxococcales bacterium]